MVTVEFLGPIQKDTISLEADTLNDVAQFLSKDAELKEWIENCAVAVNDTMVLDLSTKLQNGDKVSLLPPVCGG